MSSSIGTAVRKFEASLSSEERKELTTLEREAMKAETQELLNRSEGTKMAKRAQGTPPPQGTPPVGEMPPITGQEMSPPEEPVQQMAPTPAVPPEPVTAQEEVVQPDDPVSPVAPVVPAPAGGIEEYIDEQETEEDNNVLSGDEMGIVEDNPKVATYVAAYGHLRIRPTAQNALEVFDPKTATAILFVQPNRATRRDANRLRRCAVEILASIGQDGLVKTARKWKAQLKRAGGGVVDYGDTSMVEKPTFPDQSINSRTETNMQKAVKPEVDSATDEGEVASQEKVHETRDPAGLSGKAPKIAQEVPEGGGSLPGRDTNLADEETNVSGGDAMGIVNRPDSDMQQNRETKDKSDSVLEDVVTTFANETLTAGRQTRAPMKNKNAQDMVPPAPPPAEVTPPPMAQMGQEEEEMEMELEMEPQIPEDLPVPGGVETEVEQQVFPGGEEEEVGLEEKFAKLYRKRAEKLVAKKTREFIARFVRCVRIAARRQALNIEPNQLKIAVADALMNEAPMSKHEVFMPMDARTATFVIERSLDQKAALAFVDSLLQRSASFMKLSDESVTQIEEDLDAVQPVTPMTEPEIEETQVMKEGQPVDPAAPSVMPDMPQMAGSKCGQDVEPGIGGPDTDMPLELETTRAAAMQGNLPINPSASTPEALPAPGVDKRNAIRFAVGATKSAALHNFFGNGR